MPVIQLAIPASPPLSSCLPPRLFQVKIQADSEVRLKIVGVRVDAPEIVSGAVCMRRMPCVRAFILSGSTVSTSGKKFMICCSIMIQGCFLPPVCACVRACMCMSMLACVHVSGFLPASLPVRSNALEPSSRITWALYLKEELPFSSHDAIMRACSVHVEHHKDAIQRGTKMTPRTVFWISGLRQLCYKYSRGH